MQPYAYMQKVSSELGTLDDADEINKIIDELEFVYEAIDPEFQDQCTQLIALLLARLKEISSA